jgi:hypothetical protein
MISTILIALAGLWLVAMRQFPGPLARRRQAKPGLRTRYSYDVCGDQPLPTWQRKPMSRMQPARPRQPEHTSAVEGW